MKKQLLAFILFLFLGHLAFAQPALAWQRAYNGPPDQGDEAVSIAVDTAGNSYVTGSAFGIGNTFDIVTIKYSPTGQQLWVQTYSGTANDNDQGKKLVLDDSANVYVIGYSKNSGTQSDITTIKYNTAGVQQWARLYNGAFNGPDEGASIAVDNNGNVFVTGYETTATLSYFDMVTIMYNAGGTQQWVDIYNGAGSANDVGVDIVNDGAGNTYVVGTSDTMYMSAPNNDIVLLKYNNAGTRVWRRVYASPTYSYDIARAMCLDRNGNILICGYGGLANQGNNYYTLKYSPAGVNLWTQFYNYSTNTYEQPWDIIADSLGNVIVTGQGITNASAPFNDYVTVKYSSGGAFQWASRYNGPGNTHDYAFGVALDDSLNIYVTGISKGTSSTLNDIATVKYDAAGTEKYVLIYNNVVANKDDGGNAIAVKDGDIYITGKSSNLTNDDYITLRYSYSAVGIDEHSAAPVSLEVFPNPSSGELHVVISTDLSSAVTDYSYSITNILGQNVKKGAALPEESTGTKSSLGINTEGLETGVYFVTVYAGTEIAGKAKFIVK
jgi:hypothetical protein